jgi:hypothetical protein
MKPFFLGWVGERESDITCVEVLRRRIAKRGENFISESSGPLTHSLFVWEGDRGDGTEGRGGMGNGTTV